jgi:hypothetical protein
MNPVCSDGSQFFVWLSVPCAATFNSDGTRVPHILHCPLLGDGASFMHVLFRLVAGSESQIAQGQGKSHITTVDPLRLFSECFQVYDHR